MKYKTFILNSRNMTTKYYKIYAYNVINSSRYKHTVYHLLFPEINDKTLK